MVYKDIVEKFCGEGNILDGLIKYQGMRGLFGFVYTDGEQLVMTVHPREHPIGNCPEDTTRICFSLLNDEELEWLYEDLVA